MCRQGAEQPGAGIIEEDKEGIRMIV